MSEGQPRQQGPTTNEPQQDTHPRHSLHHHYFPAMFGEEIARIRKLGVHGVSERRCNLHPTSIVRWRPVKLKLKG